MAQVKKRLTSTGEVRWDVRCRVGGRVVTRTFRRRREADAFATQLEADRLHGVAVDPRAGHVTFQSYASQWLTNRPDLRARTKELYDSLLRLHLFPTFGELALGKVTPGAVRSWYASLAALHPSTAAKAYRLLRTVFNTAVADELIIRSPCRIEGAGVERPEERPTATVAEVEALADAVVRHLRALILLACWCGLRRGELLGLQRRDLNLLHGVVTVERTRQQLRDGSIRTGPPKTAAGRRKVAIPPHLTKDLGDHLAQWVGPEPSALLFVGEKGGPLRVHVLQKAWSLAREEIGRPDLHLHDLRHSGNIWAAGTGASTRELMARMGHVSSAAALRYQHATEDRDRMIAEALSGLAEKGRVIEFQSPRDGRAMEGK